MQFHIKGLNADVNNTVVANLQYNCRIEMNAMQLFYLFKVSHEVKLQRYFVLHECVK